MRIGYGFNRSEKEFKSAKVQRVWIDFDDTDRNERTTMLVGGIRPGDTIVLLAPGDLGRGGELPMLRKDLKGRGVAIEVIDVGAETRMPVGRPSKFTPTGDQETDLRSKWHDVRYSGRYVYGQLCDAAGWAHNKQSYTKARNWLNNRFGSRVSGTE